MSRRALKRLRSYDAATQTRLKAALDATARSPHGGPHIRRLAGDLEGTYRRRMGDYRIIYEVLEAERTVYVLRIGTRGQVY